MKKETNATLIFDFLREIASHNSREWFAAHRDRYETAREAFEEMTTQLIARIATFDPSIAHLSVKDCTYRFYRDTRFSTDKTPYKRHFGAYLSARGKKSQHGGYYLHLEPENCLLAGGAYCLEPKLLRAVRESIVENMDEFRGIVEHPKFRAFYPTIGESRLKTVPKGFAKDFAFLPYIRPKDYSVLHQVPDQLFYTSDWLDQTEDAFRTLKPFLDFVNYTIDEAE
ncbi:MAG: DUF2461 domain-containing protein [Bacteroidaceae bacterium]